jgi:hypothetical protein
MKMEKLLMIIMVTRSETKMQDFREHCPRGSGLKTASGADAMLVLTTHLNGLLQKPPKTYGRLCTLFSNATALQPACASKKIDILCLSHGYLMAGLAGLI